MKGDERIGVVLSLIQCLNESDSWCGETHVQKATYFLQELMRIQLGFDFILYKYGPYSFELGDEIASMRAYGLLGLEPRYPYGPKITLEDGGTRLLHDASRTLSQYAKRVKFIAQRLGPRGVAQLERLGTALYVAREGETDKPERLAARIHTLKPHISEEEALEAIREVNHLIEESESLSQ